jgi:hypothetical protein
MKFAVAVLLAFLLPGLSNLRADKLPGGSGIMYDSKAGYCFTMTAPKGWILDNETVKDASVCAVFYPVGGSWGASATVMYINTRPKTNDAHGIDDVVKADIDDMHAHGSPGSKAAKIGEVKLRDGRVAEIYEYTGDAWGNFERTALIAEAKGINAVVLSARSQKAMEAALPAFGQLVASYRFMVRSSWRSSRLAAPVLIYAFVLGLDSVPGLCRERRA